MTWLDTYLQGRRISQARAFLAPGDRVLDIGSVDGAMFEALDFLGEGCLGIDPTLGAPVTRKNYRLLPGYFPQDMPATGPFDAVTMLAVLEHFPKEAYNSLGEGCWRFLKPGGVIIITVPSPRVDKILAILQKMRLVHGMSLEEHHGYEVRHTSEIFSLPCFRQICHRTFQFNLNNIFVFERTSVTV
jgi:2-polyprenyl-3-methyl-5-hydroxy-6-metoxy-1,4-benzoquinol methylase